MIRSMTGFGSSEISLGAHKVSVELRSTNHKFLETSLHLPEGSLSLEEKIKKIIEGQIKRGRVTCSVNISGKKFGNAFINKQLLKRYLDKINKAKKELGLFDSISLDTLINLPGVLTLEEEKISAESLWPRLKIALSIAVHNLSRARKKEGAALQGYLKRQAGELRGRLSEIKRILKGSLRSRLKGFNSDEERASFLKDTDTTEEIDRLGFHIGNFKSKINSSGAIGKELDFIAQEMQREANTLAAKTFDVAVSAQVLKVKSLIEKIREQVQNIE
ncbi:MAG: YicC family protein [Candidatus Omnitrophica bacterium]|nr:YicC family protein [Candidatus Omnitrophota bacterium]MDD5664860.1 YicC family protein [Candidatus Omnitrophota bacterium]